MQIKTLSFLTLLCTTIASVSSSGQTWYWTKQADSSASQTASQVAIDRNNNLYYTGYCSGTRIAFGNIGLDITGSQSDFLIKYNTNGTPLWAKNATALNSAVSMYGMSLATDRSNNIIETGYYNDSIAFGSIHLSAGSSSESMYVVKYDENGNVLWATSPTFTPASISGSTIHSYSVKCDTNNNIFVTGYFKDTVIFGNDTLSSPNEVNMFLVKYNSSGVILWAKTPVVQNASSLAYGFSVAADDSGNAYVAGNFSDSVFFGPIKLYTGTQSIYIAKYDANGNAKWAMNTTATPGQLLPTPVIVDRSNHVYLGGQFTNLSIAFGTYTVTNGSTGGASNALLIKYDGNGNVIWATCADYISQDEVNVIIESSVATDRCNSVYWSGLSADSFGVGNVKVTIPGGGSHPTVPFAYVIKLDSNANPIAGAAMANQNPNSFSNYLAVDSLSKALFVSELVSPATLIIGSDTVHRYLTNSTCFLSKFAVIPTITNNNRNDSICLGDSIVLSVASVTGTTYTWSTGATTDSIVVKPPNTTTYFVAINNGCVIDTSFIKIVVSSVNPSISGTDSICRGDTDLLIGGGGLTYRWSSGQTTDSIKVAPATSTTYTLTISSGGCHKDTMFTVNIKPTPVASITATPADSVCRGDSVLLTGSGGTTFLWNTGATSSSIWVTPATASTYTLHVTASSCPDSTTYNIKIIPAITATVTAIHDTICPLDTAILMVTGSSSQATYKWNTGATTATIHANPSVTTIYTVNVYGICDSIIDTVRVTVIPLPALLFSGASSKCKGEKDTVTVSGGTTYLWNNGTTSNTYFTGDIDADSTISVISYNSLGCPDTAQFKITIAPSPTVNVIYPAACINNPVVIYANATGTGPFTYLWSPGGQTSDSITVTDVGQTETIIVSNGCKIMKTFTVTPDNPPLYACCDKTILLGDDTIIVAGGVTSYQWSPPGSITCLNPPLCDTVKVSPTVTTTYTVTGQDSLKCDTEQIITIIVEIPCFNFTVPNVFTPNYAGANGLDNVFYIKSTNLKSWSIVIYDRWGKEMYNSTNSNEYWSGDTEGGDKAPDGVYYYVITGTCQNTTYKKEGFVQLIR